MLRFALQLGTPGPRAHWPLPRAPCSPAAVHLGEGVGARRLRCWQGERASRHSGAGTRRPPDPLLEEMFPCAPEAVSGPWKPRDGHQLHGNQPRGSGEGHVCRSPLGEVIPAGAEAQRTAAGQFLQRPLSGRREQGARGRRRQKWRHGAERPPAAKCVTFRNRVADRDVPCEDAGLRSSAWGGDAGSPQRGPGHEGFSAPQPGDTGWPGHRGQSGTHSSWEMWAVGACAR